MKRVCTAFLILSTASIMLFAKEVNVVIGTGEHWKTKVNPQRAVWLEDTDGNYVRTLYVTRRVSKQSWIFAPQKDVRKRFRCGLMRQITTAKKVWRLTES